MKLDHVEVLDIDPASLRMLGAHAWSDKMVRFGNIKGDKPRLGSIMSDS